MFRASFVANVWGICIPCIMWVIAAIVPSSATSGLVWAAIVFETFWTGFIPIYNRYGTKHPANHTHTRDFERIGTITESESGKAFEDDTGSVNEKGGNEEKLRRVPTLTPHLSMR